MKYWHKLVLALAVLGTCVLVGGVAFAATSKRHAKAPVVKRVPAASKQHAKARSVQKAKKAKAKQARAKTSSPKSSSQENTADDPDNIQSGDQTGPDNAEESESESESDNEQGQRGEPAGGYEDPPGDVNHECTGDCQE